MSARQILVVDDERIVAAGIKSELEFFGYHVTGVASTAADAVDQADRDKPDLVLMDIHLDGDVDGVEAARQIHARSGTPVVFLSAFADQETIARAGETEAYGYLLKPYEERELQTTIEMAIAKHDAEKRLAETERWQAAILEGVDNAVIAIDPGNRIRFINLVGEAMTGWRKGDAIGMPVMAVCILDGPRGRILLDEVVDSSVSESRVVELPAGTDLVRKDGAVAPVEGCLSPIFDPHSAFLGIVITLRSTRVRLELERVRRLSEEQARQTQKLEALSRLAGGMAHHLNNLLTVVLGNTALARPGAAADSAAAIGRVDAAGHQAVEVVRRLMAFAGRGRGQVRQADLNRLAAEFATEFEPYLDSRVRLAFRPGPGLWPVRVDEVQFGQALLNLCLFAQDAMPTGGTLTLQCDNLTLVDTDAPTQPPGRRGDVVRVRVSDTGRGLAPDVRTHVFDPRIPPSELSEGVGSGLAFVREVVEQHHGWIECLSEAGGGTRFDLFFPRYGAGLPAESPTAMPAKPAGPRPTILLAEAEPMVREFGRQILEAKGYRALVAEDGVQAVELYRRAPERIDLVILDLNIPRLTGDAVLAQLLELDPAVRVYFSSGYFAEDRCERGTHALGVISKPYSPLELVRAVEHAVAAGAEPIRPNAANAI